MVVRDRRRIYYYRREIYCIVVAISFVMVAMSFGIAWLAIRNKREERRKDGLMLMHELETKSLWLESEMDVVHDAEDVESKVNVLSEKLIKQPSIALSSVDFVIYSRTAESQAEAQIVARQCTTLVGELSGLRQQLNALASDGTNIVHHLKNLASSSGARDVVDTREALCDKYDELRGICARTNTMFLGCESTIADNRKFSASVSEKILNDNGWRKIRQGHLSYVTWTNALANVLMSFDAKSKQTCERFATLQQFPFDRANTVDLTRKKMREELHRTESLVPAGMDLFNNSSRRVDEALSHYQTSATVALESLLGLQKAHGDFVDASSVTFASQLVDSFTTLRQSAHKSISGHIAALRSNLDKVAASRKTVEQALLSLSDNEAADERLARICETGLTQVRNLSEVSVGLRTSIQSLSNYVAKVQSEAKEKADGVAASLRTVEQSLPDWRTEGNITIKELDGIRRAVIGIRTSADNLNKTFVYCRDNNNHGTMSSLRKRMDKTFEMLKSLEAGCTGTFPCSNGVELKALMQRRDKAKRLVELVNQKVLDLSQETDRFLADGTLRKIKFVEYTESFSSQLQNGVRHFDFALEIPSEGRHQIEIRFAKGGRSLYKMSPPKKHKVVMKCVVSGVQSKETELSWKDSARSWRGNVTLDGNFGAGINDICLDLSFKVEDVRGGESILGGTWQYQYESRSSSSIITQDNFEVEFWVDGIKGNVLFGVSAQ